MKRLLLILLFMASVASAQFTITTSAFASSDGFNVWESFGVEYTPGCSDMCPAGSFKWFNGSHRITSSLGGFSQCDFSGWTQADSSWYGGCDTSMGMSDDDASYTGTSTLDDYFNDILLTPPIYTVHSSYWQSGCIQMDQITWACEVIPFGDGCPGKCTTSSSKIII